MAPEQERNRFCDTTLSLVFSSDLFYYLFQTLFGTSSFYLGLTFSCATTHPLPWLLFLTIFQFPVYSTDFSKSSDPYIYLSARQGLLIFYKQDKLNKSSSELIWFLPKPSTPVSPSQCAQERNLSIIFDFYQPSLLVSLLNLPGLPLFSPTATILTQAVIFSCLVYCISSDCFPCFLV